MKKKQEAPCVWVVEDSRTRGLRFSRETEANAFAEKLNQRLGPKVEAVKYVRKERRKKK